jgi:predicted short-subunit dehydrogenase-like oxidoreductase (DUF2520 family)
MNQSTDFFCGIVGAGKLGSILAGIFEQNENLLWIMDKNEAACIALKKKLNDENLVISSFDEADIVPDIVFIAVNDDDIESADAELTQIFGAKLRNKSVVHFSGSQSRSVLSNSSSAGAKTAAMHPFQTFFKPSNRLFDKISWGIDAGDAERSLLTGIVSILGGKPVFLSDAAIAHKELYHMSAVISSNYLISLLALSADFAGKAGVSPIDFLPGIIETTVNNFIDSLKNGQPLALTGPVARGEIALIKKHLGALDSEPALQRHYARLGLMTSGVALDHGLIDRDRYQLLKKTFKSVLNDPD